MDWTYGWSMVVLAFATALLVAILLPPLDALLESHEALHHLQHGLSFGLGLGAGVASYALVARTAIQARGRTQTLARDILVTSRRANPGGLVSLLLAAGLLVFWHVPFLFNLAVEDDAVHVIQHLSLILAGGAVGFGLHAMSRWTRLGAALVATLGTLFLSVVLVVFELHVYQVYPREHELVFGVAMIYAMMPLMLVAVYRFLVEQVS